MKKNGETTHDISLDYNISNIYPEIMQVAFVQMKPEFGKTKANVEKALSLMAANPAELYVLPELFNTGYAFISQEELANLAETAQTGYTSRVLSDYAKKKNAAVVFGFAEKASEGLYNSCLFVDKGGNFRLYRKLHLFFNEKKYFLPGNLPLDVFTYKGINIGMMICFDWIFPEITRCLALMGADIICHPANLVMPYCQDSMKTRSVENHIYTVTANRIGEENRGEYNFTFTGKSQITDCSGNIIFRASENKEEVYYADIMIEEARNKNINDMNNLWLDRQIMYYKRLGEK